VNATDLRSLRYPAADTLAAIGDAIGDDAFPDQHDLDRIIRARTNGMADENATADPVEAKRRTAEALDILRALNVPKAQQNDRSALTLLALLDVRPATAWANAGAPLIGITPIMEFIRGQYGKDYAPNTRETIRRQTMHQFVQIGLVVQNPDNPGRPVNSPANVYQVEPAAL